MVKKEDIFNTSLLIRTRNVSGVTWVCLLFTLNYTLEIKKPDVTCILVLKNLAYLIQKGKNYDHIHNNVTKYSQIELNKNIWEIIYQLYGETDLKRLLFPGKPRA